MTPITYIIEGPEAMTAFGHSLADILQTGDIIALDGDLGAGKSTLARGIIEAVLAKAGSPIDDIPSPTFTLVQSYPWGDADDPGREIWHFDLWRLDGADEVIELGFDEALHRHAMLIEWPDRLGDLLPEQALRLTIDHLDGHDGYDNDEGARRLTLSGGEAAAWPTRLKTLNHG